MNPYFFIDIELIDSKQASGNFILSRDYLLLLVKCLKTVKWDKRFFERYHIGEYDNTSGNELPGMQDLLHFEDIIELAESKKSIYLFSKILLTNHSFSEFETNRFTLNISNKRLTFKFPYWFIRNAESCIRKFKTEFHPIAEFEQFVDILTEMIGDSDAYFLRRANIRFLGIDYIKFRPSFDTFFLSDSSLYEVYHTEKYSARRKMPDYIKKLVEYKEFSGINRTKKNNYVYIQWIEKDFRTWGYLGNEIKEILSKRHEWLSKIAEITKSNEFNEYGEKPLLQKIPLKPTTPFLMNKNTAFVEIGINEKNVYDTDTRESLKSIIKELKQNKQITKVNIITDTRNAAYLLMNEALFELSYKQAPLRFENEINAIFYRNNNSKVVSLLPVGKWKNHIKVPMVSIPVCDIELSHSQSITKSENYIIIRTFTTISCFKKTNNNYIPVWMIRGGMDFSMIKINEAKNRVDASDGFMGDLTPFTVELHSGIILDYGEHENLLSIELYDLYN